VRKTWPTLLLAAAVLLAAGAPACARKWVVDQRHPQADDKGPGTEQQPFKTVAPAAEKARPGDTVLVHKGVYRERVAPARGGEEGRPILYLAAPRERVVIKGSEVWKPK